MPKTDLELKELLELPLWEDLQDRLAALTDVAMMCIDTKGRPVTKRSGAPVLCGAEAEKLCCSAMAALEAARFERPCIYLFHRDVAAAAVPVSVDSHYLGAVILGQVRLPAEDLGKAGHLITDAVDSPAGGEAAMEDLYKMLPLISCSRLEKIADFVRCLVDYTAERYRKILEPSGLHGSDAAEGTALPADSSGEHYEGAVPRSSPVYPAVVYVHEHLTESISMNAMARLCHLSASYFSRIFSREAGESFVSYVNRNKVELAKTKLRESNRSVSQIASEVGFHDTSHFISLFKRFEGVTPTSFRQMNCR